MSLLTLQMNLVEMPGYIEVRVSIIMTGSHDIPVWRLRMMGLYF